ncbi:MAG: di-trans,poly-cis-decaprenylcistransferase [Candidatus Levybacteria bacterium]|nr:di-trans,poly-cis-decaprenylcistransferase [Candidatus Levybacteria bacterium]
MKTQTTIIPQHVAIIMDGNRRWAREHKLELIMGHDKGAQRLEQIVEHAADRGIQYMTFWAFSTENWKRGKVEVEILFQVFKKYLAGPTVERLIKKGVKIQLLGDYKAFPKDLVAGLEKMVDQSKSNSKITINLALNYGGRAELVRAVQEIVSEDVKSPAINDELITQHLYTKNQPDPDLIIRTGGEQRLSGYLPWQSIYSELYFTNTYWPDFDEEALDNALEEYANRNRRFGK